jgi:uncharacterized protein
MTHSRDIRCGPLSLLVVQPTPFCNIDCDYCYLPDRQVRGIIEPKTLEALFAAVFASSILGDGFSLLWHAGEPLVLPISFYEQANALLARHNLHGTKVRVCFQTNGLLISDAWCQFFLDSGARVGVSLDGPRDLHDRHRRTRGGRGTFEGVMAGVRRLQRAGVAFSVICVLTREALLQPGRIFDFFEQAGIKEVGFNIEELEGSHASTSIGFGEARDLTYRFMEEILRLREDSDVKIREIDSFGGFLKHGQPLEIGQQCTPLRILSMDYRGNLSTFSPELLGVDTEAYGRLVFGNIHDQPIEGVLTDARFQVVYKDILAGVETCRSSCGYFSVCGGDAPANKLFERGSFAATETIYCRSKVKAITDLLLDYLG